MRSSSFLQVISFRYESIVFDLGCGEPIQEILINRIEKSFELSEPIQLLGQLRLNAFDFVPEDFIRQRLGEDQVLGLGLNLLLDLG